MIESTVQSFALRNLMEKINAQIGSYTPQQIAALKTMCQQFKTAMKDWNIANILAEEN